MLCVVQVEMSAMDKPYLVCVIRCYSNPLYLKCVGRSGQNKRGDTLMIRKVWVERYEDHINFNPREL